MNQTYCEVCLEVLTDDDFDYRFDYPICLECVDEVIDKVWGTVEGQCAWCLKADAVTEYASEFAGTDEWVLYQVCAKCYDNFAPNDL